MKSSVIAGSYSDLGQRTSDVGNGALSTTHQGRGHRNNANCQDPCRAILKTIEAATLCDVEHCFNFGSEGVCDVEAATT